MTKLRYNLIIYGYSCIEINTKFYRKYTNIKSSGSSSGSNSSVGNISVGTVSKGKCMCYNSWCVYRHPQSLQLVLWLGTEGCDGGYRSAKELFLSLLVLALFVLNLLLNGTNKGVPWVYAVFRKPFF